MIITIALDTDDLIRLIGAARAIRTEAGRRGGPRIDAGELAALSQAIDYAEAELDAATRARRAADARAASEGQ